MNYSPNHFSTVKAILPLQYEQPCFNILALKCALRTIAYADCSQFMEVCQDLLDIRKLPQFVTFKTTGGYEIDYVNKPSYHDVSAFIKESLASPLHVLSVEEYDSALRSGELWIIDYFAPVGN
ncbi:hypothetical protein COOONC_08707 [Cooperia oncophora]